jgi:hypothetical protein
MYMEISQGNSLCSYLYLKQAKVSFFPLLSSTKSENRKAEQVLPGAGEWGWYQCSWEGGRERGQEDEHSTKTAYTCM